MASEAKLFDGAVGEVIDGFIDGVGEEHEVDVARADGAAFDHVVEEGFHGSPELSSHDDDREVLYLTGLDEGEGLKHFIHGAEAAGHHDEAIAVFEEEDLADEEVFHRDPLVEVGVMGLLEGEFDVAADGAAVDVFGAPIGGFHDAGAAAGDDGETEFGDGGAHLAGELVGRVIFFEARGAEDGDAGADEVEAAEAVEEVANDFEEEAEFFEAAVGATDEVAVIDFAAVGFFGVFVFGGGGEGRGEDGRHGRVAGGGDATVGGAEVT